MTTSDADPYRRNIDSTPGNSGDAAIRQKAKEDMQEVKSEMSSMAREKAAAGQHQIKEGADALSDAIDAAASSLDEQDREGLARYARKLSSGIASAAEQIESRSIDELAKDAKQLARDNPALFMLGSIAIGFGLSRFFKASTERPHHDDRAYRADTYRTGDIPSDMPSQRPVTNTYGTSTSPYNDGGNTL